MQSFLEPGFFLQAGTLRPYGKLALVFIGNLDFLEGDLDFLVGESSYEKKNATPNLHRIPVHFGRGHFQALLPILDFCSLPTFDFHEQDTDRACWAWDLASSWYLSWDPASSCIDVSFRRAGT